MANTVIQLKHSTETGNVPSSLANGEISINSRDGKFFYSTPANVVVTHYPYPGPAGLNQEIQFNDSGVLGSDSGLTYNKTTDVLTVTGGAIIGGVNVTPQIQLAFTQANSNFISAVTRLTVTNSGASAYLIDQYSGNNPSIYVSGGETLAFQLNNVTGHPFMIRVSSGGANYDTGLTHVSNTGTVVTESSAQGKVTGTLYWKVPFSIVGSTYVYQCSNHGGMVGNIVIQQPASFVAANTTLAFNQANAAFSQANNESGVNDTQNNSITVALNTANAAFVAANAAISTDATQNNSITAAFLQANTPSFTANSAAIYANGAFTAANAAIATDITQNNSIIAAFTAANTPSHVANSASIYANGAFTAANTPSHVANSAAIYANGAFTSANAAIATDITQNNSITAAFTAANTPSHVANSAAIYANGAFAAANAAIATDITQNNSITAAFSHANASFAFANTISGGAAIDNVARNIANSAAIFANTPSHVANSASIYANAAFLQANTPSHVANSAASYANAAFARANNSLDANNGGTVTGTITANSFITTGSFGSISGANTIYANNFVANTGFIQFADGSKQHTANAGGSTTDTFARNQANASFLTANAAYAFANTLSSGSVDTFARNQANAAFIQANTGTSSSDYFPTEVNWGNFTDATKSSFNEDLIVLYDCRVEPITPRGRLLTKDFGYIP